MDKLREFKIWLPKIFTDWDLLIPITQAMLETGRNFESVLSQANNFWGIKPWSHWKGLTTKHDTTEVINGVVMPYPQEPFIKCPSVETGMRVYYHLIKTYHPKTYLNRNFYKGYFTNIASWATDPDYTSKLIRLYEELRNDITEREQWSTSS
jgi:flagellum-specific peptidoglycan hydrolase FlgJ